MSIYTYDGPRVWIDHDRTWLTCLRFTVPEDTAQRMSTEAAVVVSLCVPPVFIIVRRLSLTSITLVLWSAKRLSLHLRQPKKTPSPSDSPGIPMRDIGKQKNTTDLLQTFATIGDEDNPLKAIQGLFTNLRNARETEDFIIDELKLIFTHDVPSVLRRFLEDPILSLCVIFVTILMLGMTTSTIYLGITSANLASDNIGRLIGRRPTFLSDPKPIWWLSNDSLDKMILGSSGISARQLFRECLRNTVGGSLCKRFPVTQVLLNSPLYYTHCPFRGDVCVERDGSIPFMTTGLVDSKVLGINTHPANRFAFERNMTCAPIRNDDKYQKYVDDAWVFKYEDDFERRYYTTRYPGPPGFDYRNVQDNSRGPNSSMALPPGFKNRYEAWASTFDPFYITHPSSTVPFPKSLRLSQPFKAGNNTVTLIFIAAPNAVLHSHERNDLVFPAHVQLPQPKDQSSFESAWFNNSTRAGIIGCVDSFKICELTGSRCWNRDELMVESDSVDGFGSARMIVPPALTNKQRYPFFLLSYSLLRSTAFLSIDSPSNSPAHLSKYPDDDNWNAGRQWEVEAQKMFKTSIVSMQLEMVRLSRHGDSLYRSTSNLHQKAALIEDLDTSFSFPVEGYRNVDGLWFISINVMCFLVFLFSRRYSTLEKRRANLEQGIHGGYHDNLWITILFKLLWSLCKWLWRKLFTFTKTLYRRSLAVLPFK